MTMMLAPLSFFLLATLEELGPFDGFLANYATLGVRFDYSCKSGTLDSNLFSSDRIWNMSGGAALPLDARTATGTWACDGKAERYEFQSSVPKRQEPDSPTNPIGNEDGFHKIELLVDDEWAVLHTIGESTIHVRRSSDSGLLTKTEGPFHFCHQAFTGLRKWFTDRGAQRKRVRSLKGGHPLEMEVYSTETKHGYAKLELGYDSSVGFLIRYARHVSWDSRSDTARVAEHFLIGSYRCSNGGFAPTEWIQTYSQVPNFSGRFANYEPGSSIPIAGQVGAYQFVASDVQDMKSPVSLSSSLESAREISAPGGLARLEPRRKSLSIEDVKRIVGSNTRVMNLRPLPHIDHDAAREFVQPSPSSSPYIVVTVILALVVIGWVVFRFGRARRVTAILILAAMASTPVGCNRANDYRLTARFSPDSLIYKTSDVNFNTDLVIKNVGGSTLRILGVDAGCSCRKIDPSLLPKDLGPGSELALGTTIQGAGLFEPVGFNVNVASDRGVFALRCNVLALPDHVISPTNITSGDLVDDEDWTFDITHSQIVKSKGDSENVALESDPALQIIKSDEQHGAVANFPGMEYRDTVWKIRLADKKLGTMKSTLRLKAKGSDRILAQAPVVWRRIGFLSTTPERVLVGARPVRVFLRCPDPSVELTHILAKPRGVRAVVVAPRELIVSLEDGYSGVIDGEVSVGTAGRGAAELRVRVVRFAIDAKGTEAGGTL